jgi:uncharacterized sodium:solute symporter family permease YidK
LGARVVWTVNPQTATVIVYRADGGVKVLSVSDTLTGDDVVTGFQIPITEIFSLGNF